MAPNFVQAYLLPAAGTFALTMAATAGPNIVRDLVAEARSVGAEARAWLKAHRMLNTVQAGLHAARAAALSVDPNLSASQVEAYAGKTLAPFLDAHGLPVTSGAVQDVLATIATLVKQDLAAKPAPPLPVATPPPATP